MKTEVSNKKSDSTSLSKKKQVKDSVALARKSVRFKFKVISPKDQLAERNSAYNYFTV